jgi:hypothetical protein
MAAITRTTYLERATTIATRNVVAYGAIPAFVYLKFYSAPSTSNRLLTASLVALSGPSTLYCALGVLEGVIRSLYPGPFKKEIMTAYGLTRGAISPLCGYGIMIGEWNKLGQGRDAGRPRVLKEEYYIYAAPRKLGYKTIEAGKWALTQLQRLFNYAVDTGTWALEKIWNGICWGADQVVSLVQWSWRITQPLRTFAWNVATTIVEWTCNRIVDLWNISQPVRAFVKWVVWDIVIVKVLCKAILRDVVWRAIIKTVIWNWTIKTLIWNWILTKFVWNFCIETIIWPPTKFVFQKIIWPTVTWVYNTLVSIISFAFGLIASATQAAFKLVTGGR